MRSIREADGKGGFSCGVPALDRFLTRNAWRNEQLGTSRTYVLVESEEAPAVLGYVALSAKSIASELVASQYAQKLPAYPMPVCYIGMFAVATAQQRRGLGTLLLRHAFVQCLDASEKLGAMGVYLDSYNADSTAFYETLGFTKVGEAAEPQPMFLPMATLRQAVAP